MADDLKADEVSERYARALFELAEEAGELDAVRADLKSLKAMLADSGDLRRLASSPLYSAEDKGKAFVALASQAGFRMTTAKFLGLLTQNGRAAALPGVIAAYERLWARKTGVVAAQVTSAKPLTKAQLDAVKTSLRQALGKDPEIETRVDAGLLGGLKVKVGSRLFDASLKTKLDTLKFALKRA
ncbi:F0F1 ATP synthase subunit delta [Brevundimonas sp.]|uniref:F0F1 ATP synthase subunit delta n=1 Tax=Brevundimonas sp. TaxID=1871086 RepID=UPI0025DC34F9|nr:F0F1 ATP synthase subunit delta [Brevundimonas sp.]